MLNWAARLAGWAIGGGWMPLAIVAAAAFALGAASGTGATWWVMDQKLTAVAAQRDGAIAQREASDRILAVIESDRNRQVEANKKLEGVNGRLNETLADLTEVARNTQQETLDLAEQLDASKAETAQAKSDARRKAAHDAPQDQPRPLSLRARQLYEFLRCRQTAGETGGGGTAAQPCRDAAGVPAD